MKNNKKNRNLVALAVAGVLLISALLAHHINRRDDAYIMSKVVKLVGNQHSCTGEQVQAPSGKAYILTAAHCSILARDGYIKAITEEGRPIDRKVLVEDPNSDLLLLEGLPDRSGLIVASESHRLEGVRTFTHGHGYDTYETTGKIVQEAETQVPIFNVSSIGDELKCESMPKYKIYDALFEKLCMLDTIQTVSTAPIAHGSSGGPMVNSKGELIGVASASGDGYSYFVTLKDIQNFLYGH